MSPMATISQQRKPHNTAVSPFGVQTAQAFAVLIRHMRAVKGSQAFWATLMSLSDPTTSNVPNGSTHPFYWTLDTPSPKAQRASVSSCPSPKAKRRNPTST